MSKMKTLGAVAILMTTGVAWLWGAQGSSIAPLTGTDYAEIMNCLLYTSPSPRD